MTVSGSSPIPAQSGLSGARAANQSRSGAASSSADQQTIAQLAKTDREVRNHEQAHLAAAGALATSGASFQYATGPDGNRYAIGGEVHIDTSPVSGDPQATIAKARTIEAAANAPADPSSQDRAVASAASQMEAQARQELTKLAYQNPSGAASTPLGQLFSLQG